MVDPAKLAASLALLRGYPAMAPFLEWLRDQQDHEMKELLSANDEVKLRQAQGAARKLQQILALIDAGK